MWALPSFIPKIINKYIYIERLMKIHFKYAFFFITFWLQACHRQKSLNFASQHLMKSHILNHIFTIHTVRLNL
jgi:hypothetical protein